MHFRDTARFQYMGFRYTRLYFMLQGEEDPSGMRNMTEGMKARLN